MRTFLISIAGLVALNVALIIGMACLEALQHRRLTKEVRSLESAWRVDPPRPARHHLFAARASAIVAAALLAFGGIAIASPEVRHVMVSRLGDMVGVGFDPAEEVAEGPDGAQPPPAVGGVNAPSAGDGSSRRSQDAAAEGSKRQRTEDPADLLPDEGPHATAPGLIGPVAVTASATSTTEITVGWLAVPNATGYQVERSPDGTTSWVQIAALGPDGTATVDAGLEPGTTYHYQVSATTIAGSSATTSASATTLPQPTSPVDLTAVTVSSSEVALEWSDSAEEIGYRIQRSLDGEMDWITIGSTGQDLTSYRDLGLDPATTYHYRIVAVGPTEEASSPSAGASVTTSSP